MIVIVFFYFPDYFQKLFPQGLYPVVMQLVIGIIITDLYVRTGQNKLQISLFVQHLACSSLIISLPLSPTMSCLSRQLHLPYTSVHATQKICEM